jgi:hypothetical protein
MKKVIFVTLLAFVIGLAIGCIATMAYSGHKVATIIFALQEQEIFQNGRSLGGCLL